MDGKIAYRFLSMFLLLALILSGCKSPEPTIEATEEPVNPTEVEVVETKPVVEPTEEEVVPEPVTVTWWSHWSDSDTKKSVIEQVIADYEAENPNVNIEMTWWQKTDMNPALRSAFTAKEGFPDIFYIDAGTLEFITAGWLEDLSDKFNWDSMTEVAQQAWLLNGPDGKQGNWAVPIEAFSSLILYNQRIFEELGIVVPDDYQYTADEFYDVARKCKDAGYAVFANGIGDRPTTGQYFFKFVLLAKLGHEEYLKLWNGQTSWDRPEVREALEYAIKVMEIPAMSDEFTTLTLSEAHPYFHTKEKACMFMIEAHYTSRAFVPEEKGGQPKDFRLGILNYPEMPNGFGNDEGIYSFGGAMAVASMSENKDIAIDILNFFAQPQYANLWFSTTAMPTGIITDPGTMPESPWDWYFDEYNNVTKDVNWYVLPYVASCGDLQDAYVAVLNEGLPQNLIDIDEAIEMLETARAKCQ